ncbi:retrovirus-related pol polyprotein from transposon TNT 1-94 [Tanacetum coccineum]
MLVQEKCGGGGPLIDMDWSSGKKVCGEGKCGENGGKVGVGGGVVSGGGVTIGVSVSGEKFPMGDDSFDDVMLIKQQGVKDVISVRRPKTRRALLTSPLAMKTRFLDGTPIAARTRLVADTHVNSKDKAPSLTSKSPKSTKVSTPSKYIKEKAQTSRKWQRWLEQTSTFSWTPKAKSKKMSLSAIKSNNNVVNHSKTQYAILKTKPVTSTDARLQLLHMDLCGPVRLESINGKQFILVVFYDYSRCTWVCFLRSKDEAPEMIKKFITRIQVSSRATVRFVRTDFGAEFNNETLKSFYEKLGITHQNSIARTLEHNGVVERRNKTLVEVARTMLMFSNSPDYLWAEAVATDYFTQNRSLIHNHHNKTPYELIRERKPNA